jgi:hypothetical protein
MKLKDLMRRAEEVGVDERALDDAEGTNDLIDLIEAVMEQAAAAEMAVAARLAQLEEDIRHMPLQALLRRAEEVGVETDVVETAVRRLIMEKTQGVHEHVQHVQQTEHVLALLDPEPEPEPDPEPQQLMLANLPEAETPKRTLHSAASTEVISPTLSATGAPLWGASSAYSIFGSMRFPVPPEARALFEALKSEGLHLKIIEMKAGQDIDKEVYSGIEHADTFLVFGTHHYGENTVSGPIHLYATATSRLLLWLSRPAGKLENLTVWDPRDRETPPAHMKSASLHRQSTSASYCCA